MKIIGNIPRRKVNNWTLPDGWKLVSLSDVCEIISGQSPPSSTYRKTQEGLPFFQGKADFGLIHPIPSVCVEPKKISEPDDILISVRAPVGPTNIAVVKCCIGRGLAAIRCSEKVERDFVLSALRLFEQELVQQGTGSTFDAINRDQLERFEIPLPPFSEQKRIAAIVRERMEAVERARKSAEEQLEAATALPTAYLRDSFSDDNCKKWQSFSVGDICVSIDYGFTASAGFSIEIPKFLRITDIQNGNVNWGQVPGCKINFEDEDSYRLKEGDIVFTRTGATTGKSFLLKDPPRAIFASYLIRLRPNRSKTLPEYFYTFFQSDRYWTQIRNQVRGGAQPNFNATMLAKLNLPLPPNSEQQALIQKIDKKFCSTQKMISYIKDQLSTINALPAALLRQAFRGEL